MHFNFAMLKSGLGLGLAICAFEVSPSERVILRLPFVRLSFAMAGSDIRLALKAMELSRFQRTISGLPFMHFGPAILESNIRVPMHKASNFAVLHGNVSL